MSEWYQYRDAVPISRQMRDQMAQRVVQHVRNGSAWASSSTGDAFVMASRDEEGYIEVRDCKMLRTKHLTEEAKP